MSPSKPERKLTLDSASKTLSTTFLILNLHCPSCISTIQTVLSSLHPKPESISYSIISRSITVQHSPHLSKQTISNTLEEAGFEIYSIIEDPSVDSDPTNVVPVRRNSGTDKDQSFKQAVEEWSMHRMHSKTFDKTKNEKHLERCDVCRAELQTKEYEKGALSYASTTEEKTSGNLSGLQRRQQLKETDVEVDGQSSVAPFVVVDTDGPRPQLFEASISIGGMTCSSCVGKISESLEEKEWVRSVNVVLLTNSASVTVEGKEHLKEIVDVVEEIGYEATLDEVNEVKALEHSSSHQADTWQASYAIGGMTCSSCVGTISKALQQHDWISTADVNLVNNTASVTFTGKAHLPEIKETIEDVGYEASLDDVVEVGHGTKQNLQRHAAIHVQGMHCDHCPSRIVDALGSKFGERVEVKGSLTAADPILRITYLPEAPNFTIRDVFDCILAIDKSFKLSIYHPPTLEERSRQMHIREQRRVLMRLLLSVIVAIPTFIIGIVLMNLISSTNSARKYITHRAWAGEVSRAEWALFILATPVYFFAADAFHVPAWKELLAMWRPGSKTPILRRFYRFGSMNLLISWGTTIAYFSSIAELAIAATQTSDSASTTTANSSYFDSVVFLTMFLLFGRFLEAYSKTKTGDAVTMLGQLRPTEAILVEPSSPDQNGKQGGALSGLTRKVDVDLLEVGDVVNIFKGASPPSDGVVVEGETKFDESSLTGESRLVAKTVGDEVFSGTVNESNPVSVQISSTSGMSMLDKIVKVVREGQTKRAPIERVADTITSHFVPLIVLIAVSTWIIWLALGLSGALPKSYLNISVGGWPLWSLQFAIAVFIVACPCGIGLAAPTALFVGGGLAAQHGILVKGGGKAFQEASDLDCIVFDKTGTLTQGGEPAVTDHEFVSHDEEAIILAMAKSLEESSSHPLAKAIVSFCDSRQVQSIQASLVEEVSGHGMKGNFRPEKLQTRNVEVIIGNEAFMTSYGIEFSASNTKVLDGWKAQGKSVALLAIKTAAEESSTTSPRALASEDWRLAAIFAVADPLRPDAASVILSIRNRGIQVWMISGDNPITARAVGRMVGIDSENIIAGVLPDQKAEKIQYLQKSLPKNRNSRSLLGRTQHSGPKRAIVAMVGDGINDSPALVTADVGIAIGSGSDVAISSADFVLVASSLTSLVTLVDLSRTVFRRVKFNFAWALIYNVIALPVAAGVLYPVKSNGNHIKLDPVWASLAMALSSVSVVCSSLLLKSKLPAVGFRQGGKGGSPKPVIS